MHCACSGHALVLDMPQCIPCCTSGKSRACCLGVCLECMHAWISCWDDRLYMGMQGLIRHFRPEMEERIGRHCEQIAA